MSTIAISYENGIREEPDFSQIYRTQTFLSSSSWVDFCVWILRIDGLQFPPFTSHKSGNRCLRNLGFDEEQWKKWVHKIALLNDDRLLGLDENSLEEDSLEENGGFPTTEEWIKYNHLLKKFLLEQRELAISLLPKNYLSLNGSDWRDAWDGDSKILEKLIDLHNQWESVKDNEVSHIISEAADAIFSDPLLQHEQISIFRINLISYPTPVIYPLCTSSGILGVSKIDDLCYAKNLSAQLLTESQN
jgi:hypothetical protein